MKITLSRTLILFSCLLCFACLPHRQFPGIGFTLWMTFLSTNPKISQEQNK